MMPRNQGWEQRYCKTVNHAVAYASRALSPAETRYAQIEKELLAIVFACDHFEAYVYGRDSVQVETDHQPLVTIVQKPLNSAPNRLQRMLLRLQKYNLHLKYKRGKLMFLADTFSRAHLNSHSSLRRLTTPWHLRCQRNVYYN